jgi:Domain of unknown function (DUF6438)
MSYRFIPFFSLLPSFFFAACSPQSGQKMGENVSPRDILASNKTAPPRADSSANVVVKTDTLPASIEPEPPKTTLPNALLPENVIVQFKRTPCFGRCPVFEFTLFSDGRLEYMGQNFVPHLGKRQIQVSATLVDSVKEKAIKAGFFDMKSHYPVESEYIIEDLPTTTTYIRSGEKVHRVENNYDAPRELLAFEQWLEKIFLQKL